MDRVNAGTLGSTDGGNPVACAAALATIDAIRAMDLNARAQVIGKTIRERFEAAARRTPANTEVRGLGAMMAIELHEDGDPSKPAPALVKKILESCRERGLLIISAGLHGNVIRILCPLVITDEQLDRGLSILDEELEKHTGSGQRLQKVAGAKGG
jgi:4-aminobutyrate aminotransferase/(S)-3-amino-2-methylpropionate transaminase